MAAQSSRTSTLTATVPDHYELDVTTFFLHCFHLADYLREFDQIDAAAFVKSDFALQRCRDIVINLKHAVMTSRPWSVGGSTADLEVSGIVKMVMGDDGVLSVGEMRPSLAFRFANDDLCDAHGLAKKCIEAWVGFGLPTQSMTTRR